MSVPPLSSVPPPARAVPAAVSYRPLTKPAGNRRPRPIQSRWAPFMFLLPYFLVTAVFFIYPLIYATILAFYQTNGAKSRVYVGLDNFRFILHDTDFRRALWNTTVFAVCSICLQLPLSLGLA